MSPAASVWSPVAPIHPAPAGRSIGTILIVILDPDGNRVEITVTSEDTSDPQAIVDGFIEQCFPDADQGEADRIGDSLVSLLVGKLKPLCLTECDVEQLISDCARLV